MPYYIPDTLKEIAEQVKQSQHPAVTVRVLLSWFGAQRRRNATVRAIREALDKLKIKAEPDIDVAYIDGLVSFSALDSSEPATPADIISTVHIPLQVGDSHTQVDSIEKELTSVVDPTFRIGRLASANRPPLSITPDANTQEAVTLMLKNDFSQLPVMTSERTVKGLFSWKSLGSRLSLGCTCMFVREAMDSYQEVSFEASIFAAIGLIVQNECVLVRGMADKICGIVTTSDLSLQFGQLGEPFLLLGEIENHIRAMTAGKVTREELLAARDPNDPNREIEDVSDLTLGELIRLFEEPTKFLRLGLKIDRKMFIRDLEDIRRIRNEVMHFDPDGISENDLLKLRTFVEFLRRLHRLAGRN
jgi:predicted transcriptional regulator